MKTLILTLTLLALLVPARAQETVLRMGDGLTAMGHAELKFAPNVATLTVGVTTQAAKAADAARQNAQTTNAVLAALKNAGVAARDIQTQSYNVTPQYKYPENKLTGYQAENSVEVTIRNLTKAGQIADAATTAGATNIGQLAYDLSDKQKAMADALTAAIGQARAKADAMAAAAGVKLGPLRSLTEGGSPIIRPVFAAMRAAKSDEATPLESRQVTVTADVTLNYAIR